MIDKKKTFFNQPKEGWSNEIFFRLFRAVSGSFSLISGALCQAQFKLVSLFFSLFLFFGLFSPSKDFNPLSGLIPILILHQRLNRPSLAQKSNQKLKPLSGLIPTLILHQRLNPLSINPKANPSVQPNPKLDPLIKGLILNPKLHLLIKDLILQSTFNQRA